MNRRAGVGAHRQREVESKAISQSRSANTVKLFDLSASSCAHGSFLVSRVEL
jgi:hypothetical protein